MATDAPLWLFGYGSLIWRPDFVYLHRETAVLHGWKRRFWQGSTDHRGLPGAPGRVVTLLPESGAQVWGTAYAIAAEQGKTLLARLDHREKGGYARHRLTLHLPESGRSLEALVYVATPANPNYLGPAPLAAMVTTMARASGPSGPNHEYVTRLADAVRAMGARDEHLFTLEQHLRERLGQVAPDIADGD